MIVGVALDQSDDRLDDIQRGEDPRRARDVAMREQAERVVEVLLARIEGDRVFIPPHLIVQAVECAPSAVSIFARDGREAMRLEGRNFYYGAHTDAPDVLEQSLSVTSGRSLKQIAEQAAALIDCGVDLIWIETIGTVREVQAWCQNSYRPRQYRVRPTDTPASPPT